MSDLFWSALALALIFEGLMPLLAPKMWRRTFTELTKLQDGQVRFFGLISFLFGLVLWWLVR